MTTLRKPELAGLSDHDRATVERVARRMGRSAEDLLRAGIFGVQAHWPAWLEANFEHSLATYLLPGALPPLVKEAMHVAVSMTNRCEY
jgi:alkylhydroperoxidase family enzyme